MPFVLALLGSLRAALRTRTDLAFENLELRQQLALLRRGSRLAPGLRGCVLRGVVETGYLQGVRHRVLHCGRFP